METAGARVGLALGGGDVGGVLALDFRNAMRLVEIGRAAVDETVR